MKETLYERTIKELPKELREHELVAAKNLLAEFLSEYVNEYYMLLAPYAKNQHDHYYTLFKVEKNAVEGIFNFIIQHVGKIQKVKTVRDRIDFYCNNQMYSLFGYDAGLVVV